MPEGEEGTSTEVNRERYSRFWEHYNLDDPQQWAHWQILKEYLTPGTKALEIGSGPRPKINIEGGFFAELDTATLEKLKLQEGRSVNADANDPLPFAAHSMDVVCAFEVLEHLDHDKKMDEVAIREIQRVLKPDGHAFVSFPLHTRLFGEYDKVAGHTFRYEVPDLERLFTGNGFTIEQFAGIDIPWPGGLTAKALALAEKHVPWLIPTVSKYLDALPSSPLRQPLKLEPWNKETAPQVLNPVSTGFFVLKPTSSAT